MTDQDLQTLRQFQNRTVRIHTYDREVLIARVLFISDFEEDLIYDLISTSRESQYEKHDEQPAYRILFKDIASVDPMDDTQNDLSQVQPQK
jgi:hypothetical protein